MRFKQTIFATVLTLLATCFSLPAQDADVIIDPEKANDDYRFQGEYVGVFKDGEDNATIGVQIVALGSGKYRARVHSGGLPGVAWKRGDDFQHADGERNGKIVTFTTEDGMQVDASLRDGVMILAQGDRLAGKLEKVERKSPTLGMKPPEGAMVLFDGTEKSTENFVKGELVLGNLLKHDCETKAKFGDHKLHLEFRTPFMPKARGQGRGNSGMYVQGRYEVQILDSFGLDGLNNECGGIYSISQPKVNMCLPPLVWQTYDVDFTAARYGKNGTKLNNAMITVKHNGVVIHDNLELPKGTPGKYPEAAGPQALYLQGHGNPVVFRNVWVVPKK